MGDPFAPELESNLEETRRFAPPPKFVEESRVRDNRLYERSTSDFQGYWEDEARELVWFEPWNQVLSWDPPHCQWFSGGKLNAAYNCLDRHLGARDHKPAIIWEGEAGEQRCLTYSELHQEVCQLANALKTLGAKKGDRVAIFLPMLVEAAVAMLACARIGAIHSVVFAGYSSDALADRINDADCKVLFTADVGYRRGKALPIKEKADRALEQTASIEHVVVVRRRTDNALQCSMQPGRDHWYHTIIEDADVTCPPEPMEAEDVLFILYTSGTTGKPKGVVHTTGGYSVGAYTTSKYVFDLRDEDIYWCTADVGWITGHTYVVYGPLQNGATVFMYEGAPDFPERDRFWDIIQRHQVTILYTAPTAIRSFMKWGDELPTKHDLSSLRLLGSVGEPINPEAWMWYYDQIGGGRCPIVDTWWQTETGMIMISGLPGVTTMKPGYAGLALPGVEAKVLDKEGNEVKAGGGLLAITQPWPAMVRTLWNDDERYVKTYFSKWDDKTYFPEDGARRDGDGQFMVLGRVDDVLNVSGHRIGTMEVESALVAHPAVAEAAVIGRKHELKGQAIVAFVSLRGDVKSSDEIREELREQVAKVIGPFARPEEVFVAADLPKTRSGKIMRRLLRDIANGEAIGDTTTLADPDVVDSLREQYRHKGE